MFVTLLVGFAGYAGATVFPVSQQCVNGLCPTPGPALSSSVDSGRIVYSQPVFDPIRSSAIDPVPSPSEIYLAPGETLTHINGQRVAGYSLEGNVARNIRYVGQTVQYRQTSQPTRSTSSRSSWIYPPPGIDVYSHLASTHGIDASGMSYSQAMDLHTSMHGSTGASRSVARFPTARMGPIRRIFFRRAMRRR